MSYQTLINDSIQWLFSDVTRISSVVIALVVIGAINGIRNSLKRCNGRYTGRIL